MKAGEEIVVLASGDTIAAVTRARRARHRLPKPELRLVKGRDEPVEVYRLA